MKSGTFLLVIVTALFSLASISCTPKYSQSKVSMSFADTNNSALSLSYKFKYVFVQAGGFHKEWDCERVSCAQIDFLLNTGDHLIQVLLLAEQVDSTTNSKTQKFYYYGGLNSLSAGDNQVLATFSEVETMKNESRLMGRYIPAQGTAAGKLLTGDILVFVKPNAIHPKMPVLKEEIFGGYLNVSLFKNIDMIFEFNGYDENGQFYSQLPLFTEMNTTGTAELRSDSPGLTANANQIVRYQLSANNGQIWEEREGVWDQQPFSERIVGFFGSNADSKTLCSKNSVSSAAPFDGNSGRALCSSSNCGTYFTWSDISVSGSVDGTSNVCSGLSSELRLDLISLGDDKGDFADFFGPFLGDSSTSTKAVDFNDSTSTLTWHWNSQAYVPGGIEIFVNPNGSTFNSDDVRAPKSDGVLCEKLAGYGFQSQGVFTPGGATSFQIPASLQGTSSLMAVCLRRPNGGYYQTGHVDDSPQNSGGGNPPAAIQFFKSLAIDGGSGVMFPNSCYPMEVNLIDSSGVAAYSSSDVIVNLVAEASGQFYEKLEDCNSSTTAISSVTTRNKTVVYYRHTTAPSTSFTLQASATGLTTGNFSYSSLAAPTATEIKVIPDFYRDQVNFELATTEQCVPFIVAAFADAGGGQMELVGTSTDTFSLGTASTTGGITGVTFHDSDSDCGGTPATLLNMSNKSIMRKWIAMTNTTPGTISNILTGCGAGTCTDQTMTRVAPGVFDHFHPEVYDSFEAGACVPIKITAYDNHKPNSYPTHFPDNNVMAITNNSSDGGLLINDTLSGTFPYECDSATPADLLVNVGTINVSSSATSRDIYYFANAVSASQNAVDLTFTYNGKSQSVTSDVMASTDGYLEVPVTSRPYADFGTLLLASLPWVNTYNFVSDGSTLSALAPGGMGLDFGQATSGTNACTSTLSGGANCNIDFKMLNNGGATGAVDSLVYMQYTDNNATTRKSLLFVKGVRQ